jgi:cation:H+ antiporter
MVLAAARLSRALGVSAVLVGALVIGFGTSAPEMLVSAFASAQGELDLAVGNIVGSNISNLTLVLGSVAVLTAVSARMEILRREGALMMAAVVVLAVVLFDLRLERWEAALLMGGMFVAGFLLVRWSRASPPPPDTEDDFGPPVTTRREALIGLATLAMTVLGADFLVRGAIRLTDVLEIDSAFVGFTILAIGTSLPELASSLAAARRGETDLALGNVMGSNLFNSLAVAGIAGLVGPGPIDPSFRPILVIMVLVSIVAGVFAVTGRRLVRREGLVLLAAFALYILAAL